jgi:hypothetical protein
MHGSECIKHQQKCRDTTHVWCLPATASQRSRRISLAVTQSNDWIVHQDHHMTRSHTAMPQDIPPPIDAPSFQVGHSGPRTWTHTHQTSPSHLTCTLGTRLQNAREWTWTGGKTSSRSLLIKRESRRLTQETRYLFVPGAPGSGFITERSSPAA